MVKKPAIGKIEEVEGKDMSIRTKAGTAVEILEVLPDFVSNGKRIRRVMIENIDEKSITWGLVTEANLDDLIPKKEAEREYEKKKDEARTANSSQ